MNMLDLGDLILTGDLEKEIRSKIKDNSEQGLKELRTKICPYFKNHYKNENCYKCSAINSSELLDEVTQNMFCIGNYMICEFYKQPA